MGGWDFKQYPHPRSANHKGCELNSVIISRRRERGRCRHTSGRHGLIHTKYYFRAPLSRCGHQTQWRRRGKNAGKKSSSPESGDGDAFRERHVNTISLYFNQWLFHGVAPLGLGGGWWNPCAHVGRKSYLCLFVSKFSVALKHPHHSTIVP